METYVGFSTRFNRIAMLRPRASLLQSGSTRFFQKLLRMFQNAGAWRAPKPADVLIAITGGNSEY
jgi:hypothetical protein